MSLKIEPVLCLKGTMDNYAYILIDEATRQSAIIDAAEAAPILKKCQELGIKPSYILTTHHHFDHVGGNEELKEIFHLEVLGPLAEAALIPGFDRGFVDGDEFALGESRAKIMSAPGHTKGHVLYYFEQDKALFTGDVLFNLCVGGLFEGTKQEMKASLQKIMKLPDDVLFYPGHEYTLQCLNDAFSYADSPDLRDYAARAESRLAQNFPVAPVRLGVEKKCNPYLQNLLDIS